MPEDNDFHLPPVRRLSPAPQSETCIQTLDGEHHYAYRKWLVHTEDALAHENWSSVLACICGKQPPPSALPAIEAAMQETARLRSRRWCEEPGMQGNLL